MRPDVVVDVGNTAIKWGRCAEGRIKEISILPHGALDAWDKQATSWKLPPQAVWLVTGVHPEQRETVAEFARRRGGRVRVVTKAAELPLTVLVEIPDYVGIDRLLDAVAANSQRPSHSPAVIIDAGSAVTVDWIDVHGAFVGGAILPGLRLMAKALHDYTALLPLIDLPHTMPAVPGTATRPAMELGIYRAVSGGVAAVIDDYRRHFDAEPTIFLTGGDAQVLLNALRFKVIHWPEMTLEGICRAAETLA